MDLATIKQLLERYYDGETSLEEEASLRAYFKNNEVPEELLTAKMQFQFFAEAQKEQLTKEVFEERLYTPPKAKVRKLRLPRFAYAAAASVALLLAGYFLLPTNTTPKRQYSSRKNPEQAYEDTKRALLFISAHLNKGTKDVKKIKKLHQAKQHVQTKK